MRVPLAPSGLRQKDIDAILEVLKSGNVTMGEKVKVFESQMAKYLGAQHFVMMNSGSSANLALLEVLLRPSKGKPKLEPGDSVLVPAIAWPTTIWPIIQLGLKPVFVDINEHNLEMDLNKAREELTKNRNIRAIFPIHPLGYGIEASELTKLSEDFNIILINDVCESLGSWQQSGHSGVQGFGSSFSFYFSHHMTTMEGGGVSTNSEETYNDLKSVRSHGWSRDRKDISDWDFEIHPSMKKFNFVSTGFNIRPMEIQAAVGIEQLKDLESFVSARRANVGHISQAMKTEKLAILGLDPKLDATKNRRHSWMHVPIRVNTKSPKESRLKAVRYLEDAGIETRPPLTGNFLRQPAMSRFLLDLETKENFPVADKLSESTFLLGCHHDLNSNQIEYLCEKIHYLHERVI
jgi:CDP-6-deoxy-D-xylo-4-hexulose-3-dehydrase